MGYYLLHQMNTFGGNFSEFSKIAKMALFYPRMKIKKFLDQKYSFDVVNNSPL